MSHLRGLRSFFQKLAALVFPYGRRYVVVVWLTGLLQAVLQVGAMMVVVQLLTVAPDPEAFLGSRWGDLLQQVLPFIDAGNLVAVVGVLAILTLVANGVVGLGSDLVRARFAHFTSMKLATELIRHYARKPYLFHVEHNSAELVKNVQQDTNIFASMVMLPLLDFLTRIVIAVGMIAFLIVLDPVVGTVAIGVMVGCYSIIFFFTNPVFSRINREFSPLLRERFAAAQELLGGIKPVTVHQCSERFVGRFHKAAHRQASLQSLLPFFAGMPRHSLETIAFCAIIGVVLFLDYTGRSLVEMAPLLAAYVFAGYKLMPTVQLLYNQLATIRAQHFALDNLHAALRAGPEASAPQRAFSASELPERYVLKEQIEFDRLSFAYPRTTRQTIHDLSLTIPKGARVAFVGPSGSGKSTLVDILLGLLEVEPGQVKVDGRPLEREFLRRWRQCVGYVPQDIFLIDATLAENIALGCRPEQIDRQRLEEVGEMAQLGDFVRNELSEGYDTRTGERGVRLSGGQRQRVGLARALYHRPSVLILDEATSALDNATEAQFVRAVEGLPDEMTIIAIAHRLSTVRHSDCLYFLREGRLIASGNYDELREACSDFRELARQATT